MLPNDYRGLKNTLSRGWDLNDTNKSPHPRTLEPLIFCSDPVVTIRTGGRLPFKAFFPLNISLALIPNRPISQLDCNCGYAMRRDE